MEAQNEFKKADEKFDQIQESIKSKVQLVPKTFMKISDVDVPDAEWFKSFCDKHFDGKQFLAIKSIRFVMENSGPLMSVLTSALVRLNNLETEVNYLKSHSSDTFVLPKTQGARK
jgi:hypothetical protein